MGSGVYDSVGQPKASKPEVLGFDVLLLSDLGNAKVIVEAMLLIETITPLLT